MSEEGFQTSELRRRNTVGSTTFATIPGQIISTQQQHLQFQVITNTLDEDPALRSLHLNKNADLSGRGKYELFNKLLEWYWSKWKSVRHFTENFLLDITKRLTVMGIVRFDDMPSEKKTFFQKVYKFFTVRFLLLIIFVILAPLCWHIVIENKRHVLSGIQWSHNIEYLTIEPHQYVMLNGTPSSPPHIEVPSYRRIKILTYTDEEEFKKEGNACTHVTRAEIAGDQFLVYPWIDKVTNPTLATLSHYVAMNEHILRLERGHLNFISPSMYINRKANSQYSSYYPVNGSIPCICSLYSSQKAVTNKDHNDKHEQHYVERTDDREIVHMINPHPIFVGNPIVKTKEKNMLIESLANSVREKSIPVHIQIQYIDPATKLEKTFDFHGSAVNRAINCLKFMRDSLDTDSMLSNLY